MKPSFMVCLVLAAAEAPCASTPEETRKLMASDIARWRKVIEQAKIERQ